MGMFTQRPEDPGAWAALPGEPEREEDAADTLPAASDTDLLDVDANYTSIVFPVAPVIEDGDEVVDEGE